MGQVRVWAIPMRTRFRGIEVREGVLLRGDAGWGEWSPFWDYDDDECRYGDCVTHASSERSLRSCARRSA